jgi:hypothetical protein
MQNQELSNLQQQAEHLAKETVKHCLSLIKNDINYRGYNNYELWQFAKKEARKELQKHYWELDPSERNYKTQASLYYESVEALKNI